MATSAAQWQELAASRFVPVRVDRVGLGFRGSIRAVGLGSGTGVAVVDAGACLLTRTAGLAADDRESAYLLSVQRVGPFEVRQLGRYARMVAGQAVLYASDVPFELRCTDHTGCVSLLVPTAALGLRRITVDPLLGRPIPADLPELHVLARYVAALASLPGELDGHSRSGIGQTTADLLRTVVLALTARTWSVPAGRSALAVAFRQHVHDHLRDPDLSVQTLAAAHRVSARYVTMVFADTGLPPPAAYIREQRLHQAARLLAGDATVADVANRCGFADPTTFTRAFRRRFDATPGEWRQARASRNAPRPFPERRDARAAPF